MGMFFLVLAVLTLSPKEAAVDPLAVATVYGSADPSQAYAMRDVRVLRAQRMRMAPAASPP